VIMTDYLVNGKAGGLISVQDRGFQYGDGLFETMLVENGNALFLSEHLDRLSYGCNVLAFPSIDRKLLEREVNEIVSNNQFGVLKIMLSRGESERGFLIPDKPKITRVVTFSSSLKSHMDVKLQHVNITLCKTRLSQQPLLAGIKHLNQLERVLARSEWKDTTVSEGLMLDNEGHVIEGTMSNVFVVKEGVIKTSDLNYAGVKGIMRDFILKRATEQGYDCQVTNLTLDDVLNADEVFITNSLILLKTVAKLTFLNRTATYVEGPVSPIMYGAIRDEILARHGERS